MSRKKRSKFASYFLHRALRSINLVSLKNMYNTRSTIYTWRSIALCSFLAFLSLISLFIARHANYIRLLTYVVTSVIDLFFSDNQFLTELKFYRDSPKFDASLFLLPLFFDLLHSCLAILQLVVRSRFSHPLFLLPRFVLLSQRSPASARSLYVCTRAYTPLMSPLERPLLGRRGARLATLRECTKGVGA